jgi:hypothetical protein
VQGKTTHLRGPRNLPPPSVPPFNATHTSRNPDTFGLKSEAKVDTVHANLTFHFLTVKLFELRPQATQKYSYLISIRAGALKLFSWRNTICDLSHSLYALCNRNQAVGPRAGLNSEVKGKFLLLLPGIEPREPGRPVRSQTPYWLRYQIPVIILRTVTHSVEPGSSVSIVSGRPGDPGLIPGRGKGFFLHLLCPDRLWGPPSLLFNG